MSTAARGKHFVTLSVPGEPVALARARMGKHGRWYTPPESVAAEQGIAKAWLASGQARIPAGVPLKLIVGAYFHIPRKPAHCYPSRCDLDNLIKLALDALQKVGAFANDSQIVEIEAVKAFNDDEDDEPGMEITLIEVEP